MQNVLTLSSHSVSFCVFSAISLSLPFPYPRLLCHIHFSPSTQESWKESRPLSPLFSYETLIGNYRSELPNNDFLMCLFCNNFFGFCITFFCLSYFLSVIIMSFKLHYGVWNICQKVLIKSLHCGKKKLQKIWNKIKNFRNQIILKYLPPATGNRPIGASFVLLHCYCWSTTGCSK